MNLQYFVLAFFSGALGSMIGGTASFVMTGFIGILSVVLAASGVNVTLFNDQFLNLVFMPCVCFNGACAAMAYSANVKHYGNNGADGNRSMYFTQDPTVLLVGGIFGVIGYSIYTLLTYLGFPADQGAVSVMTVGFIVRFLFGTHKWKNRNANIIFRKEVRKLWPFQICFAAVVAYVVAYFVDLTGLTSIGFSVSALSLIFAFSHPDFPATHHISMVAGYAVMQTGNIFIAVLFGILAQLIFILFTQYFNTDLDTHIDGPAVAIATCSLIIFTCL